MDSLGWYLNGLGGIGVVSGWFVCKGLVRFARWVVWVVLG